MGAKLVSIHDDNERRFIASVDSWDGDSWIGLKRNDNGGFEWIDGSPLDYTSWGDGEPNNGGKFSGYRTSIEGGLDKSINKAK